MVVCPAFGLLQIGIPFEEFIMVLRPGHTATEKRETRNEKTIGQSKTSSSPILFLGTRKLDDFQDRQPTDFLPPRKIFTNQREVQ